MAEAEAAQDPSDPNTMMADMGEQMALMNASALVTESTEESAAALDVVGFNYADSRYALDAELFPHRVIVGSETFPAKIDVMWDLVTRLPHVIGDFTWTGWDYLGEAGIGRVDYTDVEGYESTGTAGPYPYLLAECGDIDITGHRRTISYYREIVFGLRTDPYIAVHRPQHHGRPTATTPWSWDDASRRGRGMPRPARPSRWMCTRMPTRSSCCSTASRSGSPTVGGEKAFRARFETEYRPGELVAVARRAGAEVGRHALRTASGALSARRPRRGDGDVDGLGYVAITLEDESGTVFSDADLLVTVSVDGPGCSPASAPVARAPRSRFAGRASRPMTAGRSRSCDRPARAASRISVEQTVVSRPGRSSSSSAAERRQLARLPTRSSAAGTRIGVVVATSSENSSGAGRRPTAGASRRS